MGVNWESYDDGMLLVETGTERVAREVYERAVIRAIFGTPMVGDWDAFKQGQWARATGRPRTSNPFDYTRQAVEERSPAGVVAEAWEWYRGWDYGTTLGALESYASSPLSTTRLQGADAPPAEPDIDQLAADLAARWL